MVVSSLLFSILKLSLLTGSSVVTAASISREPSLIKLPIISRNVIARENFNVSLLRRDGALSSAPIFDWYTQYLVGIGIGTPAQQFQLILDTGSTELWVASEDCPSFECPSTPFITYDSSTFNYLDDTLDLSYGTGTVIGQYGTDVVTLAGIQVQNQKFGLAEMQQGILHPREVTVNTGNKEEPSTVRVDGILGFGYQNMNAQDKTDSPSANLFYHMIQQNLIKEAVFSISLGYKDERDALGWSGELALGGANTDLYTGSIEYAQVANKNEKTSEGWEVFLQDISITKEDGEATNIGFDKSYRTIIDTGTTLTYIKPEYAKKTLSALTGQTTYPVAHGRFEGLYVVDCNYHSSDVRVKFSYQSSTSKGSPIINVDVPVKSLIHPTDTNDLSTAKSCVWGIVEGAIIEATGENIFIFGENILRNTYLTFDAKNSQVGFSAAVGTTTKVTKS
ncbi:aspartic peptidase domain-containing protein [Cokeromyces recurvatus]|uniref:aspartic peptidase domain-containing protein n=1 Tax=Cokeromyces recurvatus TaxID=90255 RepID=UPI00221F3203|nr:aspartic peptidase domain-containing protein [Cokeromyces recurvatus]KAI7902059.1 aspartic peptidase domain-containing protein [Cokeromyces recurvatus]